MGTIKVLIVAGLLLCTLLVIVLMAMAKEDTHDTDAGLYRQLTRQQDMEAEKARKNQADNLENAKFEERMRRFDADDRADKEFWRSRAGDN